MNSVPHFDLAYENWELASLAFLRFPLTICNRNPLTICNLLKMRALAGIYARKFCKFASLANCEIADWLLRKFWLTPAIIAFAGKHSFHSNRPLKAARAGCFCFPSGRVHGCN